MTASVEQIATQIAAVIRARVFERRPSWTEAVPAGAFWSWRENGAGLADVQRWIWLDATLREVVSRGDLAGVRITGRLVAGPSRVDVIVGLPAAPTYLEWSAALDQLEIAGILPPTSGAVADGAAGVDQPKIDRTATALEHTITHAAEVAIAGRSAGLDVRGLQREIKRASALFDQIRTGGGRSA